MKKNRFIIIVILLFLVNLPLTAKETQKVFMANGIKIGEVSVDSAIIWTRLTKCPDRNINGKPFPENINKKRKSLIFDNLDEMKDSVAGIMGDVRISYWPDQNIEKKMRTNWQSVRQSKDFTCQVNLVGLLPGTHYSILAEGRTSGNNYSSCKVEGSFRTAPKSSTIQSISFAVVTGQDYPRRDDLENGHKIYPVMQALELDFFIHTGDAEYYDKPGPYADNLELARFKWNRIYAMPNQRAFHNQIVSYFIKDDHDTLRNDCWPGQRYGHLTWEQGLSVFREQVPIGDNTYRTVRWGKDLQIWIVEGRDFRSPNTMQDGPEKTIWGENQKKWFFETVSESDATIRILVSPTPIVGPDRDGKNDNHANKGFKFEGDELRSFIGNQKNMFVICGDRHWQYVSVDPMTGVREYSCGPTSDAHASGFNEKDKFSTHQYLNIKGGFLSSTVERMDGIPRITFRHHGVNGMIYNEDVVVLDTGLK